MDPLRRTLDSIVPACKCALLLLCLGAVGCSDGSTAAPPITGKVPKPWAQMTKEEKIESMQNSKAPEEIKRANIARINAGQM